MAHRNTQFSHSRCRKQLLAVFIVAIFLVILTLLSILRYVAHPHLINRSLLPEQKILSLSEQHETPQRKDDDFLSLYPSESHPLFDSSLIEQNIHRCDPSKAILKVFMYDLPPEFHFGLLGWKTKRNSVWPDIRTEVPCYPGGLNLQHSIEYWLTLDILSSNFANRSGPCTAVRVADSREADVVFVPFFSSLSYNRQLKATMLERVDRNKLLQEKLTKFLMAQEEWKRSGGLDHVIVAHHPNSMLNARMKLRSSTFILADFGRYLPTVANVDKDVVAPYKHLVKSFVNDSSGFDDRATLLYFQGAIFRKDGGIIRKQLFKLLKDEPSIHFSFGNSDGNGVRQVTQGMRSSKFCLHVAGDTPSSNRLFDAIASHCVPVVISDNIELPYEDVLDYSKFCIFIRSSDAIKKDFIVKVLRGVTEEEWTKMWERLKEVEGYFEFQYPSRKDDAVQMIWQAVARKVAAVQQKLHKSKRFSRYHSKR